MPQAQYGADQGARGPAGRPLRLPLRRAAHRLAGGGVRRRPGRRQRGRARARARSARCAARIAQHRGAEHGDRASTWCPSGCARARAHGVTTLDLEEHGDDLGERSASSPAAAGPDAVIDAVGMEAHGAPIGKLAQRLTALLPDAVAAQADGDGRRRPPERAAPRRSSSSAAAARSRSSGVYGGAAEPDAAAAAVRQADHAAHGPGQRQALDRRPHAAGTGDDDPLGVDDFATHHLPLDEAPHAYETSRRSRTATSRCCCSRSRLDHPSIRRTAWRSHRLRLRRSSLAEVHREDRHRSHREKLGLPVLERALPEARALHVIEPAHRSLMVREQIVVVLDSPGHDWASHVPARCCP